MKGMEDELRAIYRDEDALVSATINTIMRNLSVSAKLLGYRYIFLAVRYVRESSPEDIVKTKRGLYPYLESCVHSPKPMIQRTIHYAITHAWNRADPAILHSYLGLRGKNLKDPPGNIEFIYLIAERVRLIIGDPKWEAYYQKTKAELLKRYPWLN